MQQENNTYEPNEKSLDPNANPDAPRAVFMAGDFRALTNPKSIRVNPWHGRRCPTAIVVDRGKVLSQI
jgi:hypothetical protein